MPGIALEVQDPRDSLAVNVVEIWSRFNSMRHAWLDQKMEVRRYLTSTHTGTTEVGTKPWKNKTTIPKLTQIADNLHAYYMAALMPNDDWFRFEGSDADSRDKARHIEAYMKVKLRQSKFRQALEQIVRDWIYNGVCLGGVTWANEKSIDRVTGEEITSYYGPKLKRVSPLDFTVDIRAASFDDTPLVMRKVVPLTDVLTHNQKNLTPPYDEGAIEKIKHLRASSNTKDWVDWYRQEAYSIDGFQTWDQYLNSQHVELLEFYGDIYNPATGEASFNKIITVADRSFVLREADNPAWNGAKPFSLSAWRVVPDNLLGQGPLDNLIGMQYRCDHLENLKADAFDQIVHPPIKVLGDTVEDFEWGPEEIIYCGAEGDVQIMSPDTTVLNADNQIAIYHNYMEMMAGSPRESAGFRTPGEKTAFEVDVLQSGADRMFLDKLNHLEESISEILTLMYEMMVRNMTSTDIARTFGDAPDVLQELGEITKEDVVANGRIRPVGAKHFAARNKRVQELTNVLQLAQGSSVGAHISSLRIAEIIEDELGFDTENIVEENIGLIEQMRSQLATLQMQQQIQQIAGSMQQGGTGDEQPPEEDL